MKKISKICFLFILALLIFSQAYSCGGSSSSSNNNNNNNNGGGGGGGGSSPTASGDNPTEGTGTVNYSGSLPATIGTFTNGSLTLSGTTRNLGIYRPSSASNLPLIIALPGTGGVINDFKDDLGSTSSTTVEAFANSNSVIFVFPVPRDNVQDSWDHGSPGSPGEGTFWETENDNADTNPDLLFFRAIIEQAHSQFSINTNQVYVIGFSNGAFMAALTAQALRSQIAAFAENSGGLVTCPPRQDNDYTTSLTNCSSILSDSSVPSRMQCSSGSANYDPEPVVPFSSGSKRPGYLAHQNDDPTVSVYYTCSLYQDLNSKGYTTSVNITSGGGHSLVPNFLTNAWNFMRNYSL